MSAPARLVAIVGPTASGKSALGIWLSQRLGGEVLVCDSTQVYRHFDIGTGKVPAAEQRGVPHHLMDLVEPEEPFTAGDYRRRALVVLEDLRGRRRLPIVTAGTGLYLRALLEGLSDAPLRSDDLRASLRERGERHGPEYLHRMLARLDPETARRVAPRDTQKVIRALEIRLLARKPVGDVHRAGRQGLEGFRAIQIGLLPPRADLYARIEDRTLRMCDAGWLGEVKGLLAREVPYGSKAFQFLGYAQLRAHLEGRMELPIAIQQIQKATRRYAKRQITWFGRSKETHWFHGFGDFEEIQEAVLARLAAEAFDEAITVR